MNVSPGFSTARSTAAFACAEVPKVNLITGKAFGSAYVTMNSKHIGADLVMALDTAEIGMMDAKAAAKIMYADEISAASDKNAELALAQLKTLKGLHAHSSVLLSSVDEKIFKRLGIQLTCEAKYETENKIYHK